jgi:hypothetical protein
MRWFIGSTMMLFVLGASLVADDTLKTFLAWPSTWRRLSSTGAWFDGWNEVSPLRFTPWSLGMVVASLLGLLGLLTATYLLVGLNH